VCESKRKREERERETEREGGREKQTEREGEREREARERERESFISRGGRGGRKKQAILVAYLTNYDIHLLASGKRVYILGYLKICVECP
jgi:hypothetical protein